MLSKYDQEIFEIILNATKLEDVIKNPIILKKVDSSVFTNFKLIFNKLNNYAKDSNVLRNVILEGLQLLNIVEMSLDKEDDPQAIFESINSLGLKLSNADLIRNYLLMSHSNQQELYTKYWEVIQDKFIGENNMETFVFNYLLMKKSYAIKDEDVYKEYVKFATSEYGTSPNDKEDLLKDLYKLAKIYQVFLRNTSLYSANTNMLMQEFRGMDSTTAYPFLMKVFLDFDDGIINEETLDKVINLIIIYLVRRTICGVPTNSLRGFMLNLYNRVFKIEINKKRYFESIYAFLNQISTNDKLIADDNLIISSLKTGEIYKKVKFVTYLLYKIENGRYPKPYSEFTLANNISVEHIMPQTLTDEWIEMLGYGAEDIHNKYLNTLGNLSLSSRSKNSIMSNEDFSKKRDILLTKGSKFIELNKDISKDQTEFGEKHILDRCKRLTNIILEEYSLGEVDIEGIKFEDTEEVVCSDTADEIFKNAIPVSFKLFGREYPVQSFSNIAFKVIEILYNKNPQRLNELAANNYTPWKDGSIPCIYYGDENSKDKFVLDNIRIHLGYNAKYSVLFAVSIMNEFGIDASQLVIFLKKDSIKNRVALSKTEKNQDC